MERVEEHVVRVGHNALHLVEHHTVIRERRVCVLELVVPTLLFENLFALVDGRMQHRIEIDVHKVHQVFLVRARNGIDRLVCEGHGVQECLHRALEQIHERFLHWKLVRTTQHRMLQDVEDARIVHRWGLEANGEGFVVVIVCQIEQARAAFVAHEGCGAVGLGQILVCFNREAVGFRSRSKVHLPSFVLRRRVLISSFNYKAPARQAARPRGICNYPLICRSAKPARYEVTRFPVRESALCRFAHASLLFSGFINN